MKTNELVAMIEDAAAKLSGEQKTDFILKIVIILMVTLFALFGSTVEGVTSRFEDEITRGIKNQDIGKGEEKDVIT